MNQSRLGKNISQFTLALRSILRVPKISFPSIAAVVGYTAAWLDDEQERRDLVTSLGFALVVLIGGTYQEAIDTFNAFAFFLRGPVAWTRMMINTDAGGISFMHC